MLAGPPGIPPAKPSEGTSAPETLLASLLERLTPLLERYDEAVVFEAIEKLITQFGIALEDHCRTIHKPLPKNVPDSQLYKNRDIDPDIGRKLNGVEFLAKWYGDHLGDNPIGEPLYQDILGELDINLYTAVKNWCREHGLQMSSIVMAKSARSDREFKKLFDPDVAIRAGWAVVKRNKA